MMVDQYALISFCKYDDITTTSSWDQRLWLYLHSYKLYNNQTSKEGRLACTDVVLHVMEKSPQPGLIINIYGFTSTSISPITTKFRRMVDQHTLILPCKYDGVTTSSHDQGLFNVQKPNFTWSKTSMHWAYLAGTDVVITTRSRD